MRHVTIKLCTHLCRRHTCYLVIVYVMHKCVVSRVKSCSHVYITKCCSMLQCVLAWTRLCHLRVLFGICVYEYRKWMSRCAAVCCSVLQRVAFCRSVLQCVAVCCSALQCVAQRICPYRIWMGHFAYQGVTTRVKASCQVWNYQEYQCAAVCCSVLQCVLQCVAQCVSVCTRLHRWRVFLGTCVCRVYVSACYSVYVIIQCMSLFSVYHYSVYVIIRCMSLFSVCRYSVYVVIQCMSLIGVCRYSERVCRHTQVCVCQL